jgi:hypothetical protein
LSKRERKLSSSPLLVDASGCDPREIVNFSPPRILPPPLHPSITFPTRNKRERKMVEKRNIPRERKRKGIHSKCIEMPNRRGEHETLQFRAHPRARPK